MTARILQDGRSNRASPTIQGTLVSAIEHLTGEKTLPQGSGRTDAGVHALAQVATVSIESPIPPDNLRKALNDVMPKSIRILSVEDVIAATFTRARRPGRKPIAIAFIVMKSARRFLPVTCITIPIR